MGHFPWLEEIDTVTDTIIFSGYRLFRSVIQGIDSENQNPAVHIEDSQEDKGHDSPEPSPGAEVTDGKQNGVAQNSTGLAKEPVPASSSRAEKR